MIDKKVLIIDDDCNLLQLVGLIFKKCGAQVITANDGLDGMSKFFTHHPDLIILDVIMPGNDGFDVCQRLRLVSNDPLIMLTALNKEEDMLRGLSVGADDFLSKPVHPDVLVARAKRLMRRAESAEERHETSSLFSYNDGYLSIDIERHEVLIHRKHVKLTPIEFRLLVYLARNSGKLLTFEKILGNVWGTQYDGSLDHVHVYISHLRRKLEHDSKNPCYIRTVHGLGYIFDKQELGYRT
jgi:two-component system alkaline phosphatase synthesis response regulator PhoP